MISKEKNKTLDVNGIIQQTLLFLKQGQVDNAIAYCQKYINNHPKQIEFKIILSHAYQQKFLFDEMLGENVFQG